MTQTLLSNMNPDAFEPPLQLFWRSALYDELCDLEDRIFPAPPGRAPQDRTDEDEWIAFMDGFLSRIPPQATVLDDVAWEPLPRSAGAQALLRRLRQSQSALGQLPTPGEAHSPPGGVLPSHSVLLPMLLRRRLEYLLDFQALPMIWIRSVQTHRDRVTAKRPPRPPL